MKIKEYTFGNAKIEVHDRAIRRPEEVEKIMKRLGKISDEKLLKEKQVSA